MICFNDVLLLQVLLFTGSCMQFFFLFVWFVSFLEAIFFFLSWRVWPWRKCVMTFVQFEFQIFFPLHFGGSVIISLFCNFFIDCLELFVYICDGFIYFLESILFVKPLIYYSRLRWSGKPDRNRKTNRIQLSMMKSSCYLN